MNFKTEQLRLEKGCGFQENSWKSSLCKKDNLCSDCQRDLDNFMKMKKMVEDAIDETEFTNILRRGLSPNDTMDLIKISIKQKLFGEVKS